MELKKKQPPVLDDKSILLLNKQIDAIKRIIEYGEKAFQPYILATADIEINATPPTLMGVRILFHLEIGTHK
jgi:hypothetical protein